jgi:phosphoglycerol transferase MdoB-like AlkP superfamily enzyme
MQPEKRFRDYWSFLLTRLALLFAVFSAARVLFFLCNRELFSSFSVSEIVTTFIAGIRFDAVAIAVFNAPVWVFWSIPHKVHSNKILNTLAEVWFVGINLLAMLVNVADAKYFAFTMRRFSRISTDQLVMLQEDPSIYVDMLLRYWHVVLVGIALACVICVIPFKLSLVRKSTCARKRDYVFFLLSLCIFVICVRGGWQRRPLRPADTNIYAKNPQLAPLANNSAFNAFYITKKLHSEPLTLLRYFGSENEKLIQFSPRHECTKSNTFTSKFKGKNVFIIILESFSSEYVGALDRQFKDPDSSTFTPFLDALIQRSYVFDGFANGLTSIDALTSVVLGVPRLMDCPYIKSEYSENAMLPLIKILKADGYDTVFFYGGQRNSCNFNSIRTKAQMDRYYCKDDYPGPSSNITGWGVYDDEFFQFIADKINQLNTPFLSVLFTLSSHHPYVYPEKLHGMFPKDRDNEPLPELIAYTDYALQKFFETAEKMDWYKNTIFVLVADHTSARRQKYYCGGLGKYSIPLMFFDPNGELVGKSNDVAQQIDIMPSILDLVGHDHSYFSFGHSLFDPNVPKFSISHDGNFYQMITRDFVFQFDGKEVVGLYQRSDHCLERNLVNDRNYDAELRDMKESMQAFLQWYTESIINNDMLFEKKAFQKATNSQLQ